MKVIIAGSRYGVNQKFFDDVLQKVILSDSPIIPYVEEIVSGAANGVDTQAIHWADAKRISVKLFPIGSADWLSLGRAAGPIRNKKMAEYGDYLIAFFDKESPCRGTLNMCSQMAKLGKPILRFHEKLFEDRAGQRSLQFPKFVSKKDKEKKQLDMIRASVNPVKYPDDIA